MNIVTVRAVERLAGEVAVLCRRVETAYKAESGYFVVGTALTAELRRRSMDLTRALADLRRSN